MNILGTDGKPIEKEKDIKFIGLKITPIGEMQVWQKGKERYSIEPEAVPLFPTLKNPPEKVLKAMNTLFGCIKEVIKMPKRSIPITRKELQGNGVSKKMVKKLSRTGLVKNVSMATTKIEEGKVVKGPSINVVYPTLQGTAFFKEFFDEKNISDNNPNNVGTVPTNSSSPDQQSPGSGGGECDDEALSKVDPIQPEKAD